jgi:hypothetical protein
MHSIQEDMEELRKQLGKGSIPKAYRALLSYMMGLRTHFQNSYPGFAVSGLYQGYMDMTYFALVPPSLKQRDLKIAIVFNYDAFRFEAWLAGSNRKVQRQYWELFEDSQWPAYRVVTPARGIDSIIECDLVKDFDFSDPYALTSRIEMATVAFIDDIERFLAIASTSTKEDNDGPICNKRSSS